MRIRFLVREIMFLLGLLSAVLSMGQDVGPLLLEKEIALPGVEGRIDHFSVDVAGERLFIAALENGSVEILDARKGERTAEIKGLEEPQGAYYDSKTGRLYVATGGDFIGCRFPRLLVLDTISGQTVTIRPEVVSRTTRAYTRACWQIFDWCAANDVELTSVRPFHVAAWIYAEFRTDLLVEQPGDRPSPAGHGQQEEVIRIVRAGSKTAADVARLFGLHRSNITRLLARATD
jgi:hypothetical protein